MHVKGGFKLLENQKKKINLGEAVKGVGKSTVKFVDNTAKIIVKNIDQNDDGEFDIKDVAIVTDTIGNVAKNTANNIKDILEEKNRQMEKKLLHPIFVEDLDDASFYMPKLIRVTDIDKKRADSDVCKDSIGYIADLKEIQIVNLFRNKLDIFGLTLYPDADYELYYVDPNDRDRYIALDEYFNYLKVSRVNELQRIAQSLGAKYFKVTLKEHKASFSKSEAKANGSAKVKGAGTVNVENTSSTSNVNTVEISAEMNCTGHAPTQPQLYFLQRDESVLNLIALRMNATSPMMHQKVTIEFSNSTGIKEKDAVKIDAALKALKISGNVTVTNEVQNESRRFFEYEIDF